jgi:hypothetical protein
MSSNLISMSTVAPASLNTTGMSRLTGTLMGTGFISQLLLVLIILLVIFMALWGAESIYGSIVRMQNRYIEVLPNTYISEDKSFVIRQDPSDPNATTLWLSDNERTGIEFSYSFFIFVNSSTFRTEEGLCHVFHKGYSKQYPLLGPGVYIHSNTNAMRVYMNDFSSWNRYIDIENIPVKKWIHCVVMCRKSALEVYINGNLVKKMRFEKDSVPYQNFGDLFVFSQRRIVVPATVPSTGGTPMNVFGSFNGMLSRLMYFPYAMTYTEINNMMAMGPSKKIESGSKEIPPYLVDTWWSSTGSL